MKYTSRGTGNSFDGGQMIKDKLTERFMTQKDLAEIVGVNPAKISEIIKGFRRPSKKELDSLGIDLNDWRKQSVYVKAVFPLAGNDFY
mgnify:CR=1 FL=1